MLAFAIWFACAPLPERPSVRGVVDAFAHHRVVAIAEAHWLRQAGDFRDVNRRLPPGRRIRVLAGDTRVDWSSMHSPADWQALGDNNQSFADVLTNDVLAKGHRAFVVLGSNHLMRTGSRDDGPNTTTRVEWRYPGSMYVAWLYNGRPGGADADARMSRDGWCAPSVVPLHDSWIGAISAGSHRFDEIADALLYLGPSAALKEELPSDSDFEKPYRRELDRRSWIEWGDSSRARTFLHLPALPPAGTVTEFNVVSTAYGRSRRVWVYQPPGYPGVCARSCPLLLTFDGGVYLGDIPLPEILDSLIAAGKMPPIVALLVDDASGAERLDDLANRAKFATFVGDELLPWLRKRWKVTTDPSKTIVTGSSAGGLASAYLAFRRPDLFGNVLSQSGAFWRGSEASNAAPFEWVTDQYAGAAKKAIRFFLDVGSTESTGAMNGTAPSILSANRKLRDVLRSKGYDVQYFEVPNGVHDATSWRTRLPVGLSAFAAGWRQPNRIQ